MSATAIELSWQPPSNANNLGTELLGYRVYLEEKCDSFGGLTWGSFRDNAFSALNIVRPSAAVEAEQRRKRKRRKRCKKIPPVTINSGTTVEKIVDGLAENGIDACKLSSDAGAG